MIIALLLHDLLIELSPSNNVKYSQPHEQELDVYKGSRSFIRHHLHKTNQLLID